MAISLVANVAANLIAFIALLDFVNSTLTWLGHRADLYEPALTFQVTYQYIFIIQRITVFKSVSEHGYNENKITLKQHFRSKSSVILLFVIPAL